MTMNRIITVAWILHFVQPWSDILHEQVSTFPKTLVVNVNHIALKSHTMYIQLHVLHTIWTAYIHIHMMRLYRSTLLCSTFILTALLLCCAQLIICKENEVCRPIMYWTSNKLLIPLTSILCDISNPWQCLVPTFLDDFQISDLQKYMHMKPNIIIHIFWPQYSLQA